MCLGDITVFGLKALLTLCRPSQTAQGKQGRLSAPFAEDREPLAWLPAQAKGAESPSLFSPYKRIMISDI